MTIEKEIWKPDYTKDNLHRIQGGLGLILSGLFGYAAIKYDAPVMGIGSVYFAIDGLGDTITGCHHYCEQKVIEGIKYISNKLTN
jgi:hypothetical protein